MTVQEGGIRWWSHGDVLGDEYGYHNLSLLLLLFVSIVVVVIHDEFCQAKQAMAFCFDD
jgi:hypothetical protein